MGTKVQAELDLHETIGLPPLGFDPPETIEAILSRGGSAVGNSAVSAWLTCQEFCRLRSLGVRKKVKAPVVEGLIEPLDDASFGSVYHAISAVRSAHGMGAALNYLEECLKPQLAAEDSLLAFHMLKTNDAAYPLEADAEQFDLLGIEVEVVSDVGNFDGSPLHRTVIYDKVIKLHSDIRGRGVYSLEVKTQSKGGESALQKYRLQRTAQPVIWNKNEALVTAYGPMHGVIFEQVTRTQIPRCERFGPYNISKHQERLYLNYTRLTETTHYPVAPDGSYPRQLHACFSRYGWCDYASLCWENAIGDYVWP